MTPTEPNIPDTVKLPISQAAEVLNVHRVTLRRYINQGLMKVGQHRYNKRTFITGRELKRFWQATL